MREIDGQRSTRLAIVRRNHLALDGKPPSPSSDLPAAKSRLADVTTSAVKLQVQSIGLLCSAENRSIQHQVDQVKGFVPCRTAAAVVGDQPNGTIAAVASNMNDTERGVCL